MRKKIIFILLGSAILFGGLLLNHSTDKKSQLSVKQELVLPIYAVEETEFQYKKSYVGYAQAVQSVDIVPYLSGFLSQVYVKPGEEVSKGETLFVLDQRIQLAKLEEAKEATEEAKATMENAKSLYNRIKNTDAEAISPTELEQAKSQFKAAEADYQQALSTQSQAQTLMDYTWIEAPIDGWVGNITATIGEYLSPQGKILARLISFSPMRLTFSVPLAIETPEFLTKKSVLEITLSNGQKKRWLDFEIRRNNQANQTTDSVSYFIDIENKDKIFVPDAYIEVSFIFHEKGILLDKNWIYLTPEDAEVFVLEKGIIQKRNIEILGSIKNKYWIKSGLSKGDKVITVPISMSQVGQFAQGEQK